MPTFFCLVLAGCGAPTADVRQSVVSLFYGENDASRTTTLNPAIRYLRVVANGRVSLLALGYIDPSPLGPIDVWYSSSSDVLKIQNGHVVGLTTANVQWRQVQLSTMPAWPANLGDAASFVRTRDVMPGYRFGIKDRLQLSQVGTPKQSNFMPPGEAQNLRWFEAREADNHLPVAQFAVAQVNGAQVAVYGDQCLTPTFCLTWQSWPTPSARP